MHENTFFKYICYLTVGATSCFGLADKRSVAQVLVHKLACCLSCGAALKHRCPSSRSRFIIVSRSRAGSISGAHGCSVPRFGCRWRIRSAYPGPFSPVFLMRLPRSSRGSSAYCSILWIFKYVCSSTRGMQLARAPISVMRLMTRQTNAAIMSAFRVQLAWK